jgi:hypothetical protein
VPQPRGQQPEQRTINAALISLHALDLTLAPQTSQLHTTGADKLSVVTRQSLTSLIWCYATATPYNLLYHRSDTNRQHIKISRIIPPGQAHSCGHVQQCSRQVQTGRTCSGIMRQPRLTTDCTIHYIPIDNILTTAGIVPPQQAHSCGHVQQCSRQAQTERACSG